ncbi:MAG: hypothetical protein ACE5K7_05060 [Phycisphaerae bacterium]
MIRKVLLSIALVLPLFLGPARLSRAEAADRTRSTDSLPMLQPKRPIVQWAVGVGFAVGCLLVAFKNSKRTHLD